MKTLLLNTARILRLYTLTLWVGGLIFFVVVAQVAFTSLPSPHEAGMVVRGSLLAIHTMGLYAGLVYMFFTVALLTLGDGGRVRAVELLLVGFMLALTAFSQYSIIPRMEADRLALGGDVNTTPPSTPAHADFDRLHNLSTRVEGLVLLAGLATLALGTLSSKPKH